MGDREQAIVISRNCGLSFAAIGKQHGITRSRAQQIYKKATRMVDKAANESSARLRNAIKAAGCEVEPKAVAAFFTYTALRRVPNIGVGSIKELNAWLVKHGEKPITSKE